MKRSTELALVPVLEAGLLLLLGGFGVLLKLPLLVTSLGPTAYEQIEKPGDKSARPYNVVVGHAVAIAAGLFAVWIFTAFSAPIVSGSGMLNRPRLLASVVGCLITAFLNLLLRSSQPAAFATTMLITLGSYQSPRAVLTMALGIGILALVGEPLRRKSLRMRENH